jgi:hypothetical protein
LVEAMIRILLSWGLIMAASSDFFEHALRVIAAQAPTSREKFFMVEV